MSFHLKCKKCERKIFAKSFPVFHCGYKHVLGECDPQPVDTRGHDHAAICRSNQCGKYDAETDTCRIQTAKGKAGAISYLYNNPDTRCPNNPPMWNNENEMGSSSNNSTP